MLKNRSKLHFDLTIGTKTACSKILQGRQRTCFYRETQVCNFSRTKNIFNSF